MKQTKGSPLRARSNLKPGKRLKQHRGTPRPNRDRLQLLRYREEIGECEFERWKTIQPPDGHGGQLDNHHIDRIKHDRPECLLCLCRRCHDYGHANDADFVVWCLWTKWKKGELDLELLNRLKGGLQVSSALEECDRWRYAFTAAMAEQVLRGVNQWPA